jgi:hypothetical protein
MLESSRAGIPSPKNWSPSHPVLELPGPRTRLESLEPLARSESRDSRLQQKLHSPHSHWMRSDYSNSGSPPPDSRSIHYRSIR